VKPVVVCGREMWPMTEMDMRRLNTSVMKILRRTSSRTRNRANNSNRAIAIAYLLDIIIDTTRKDWDGLGIW
jgi:hypothetical protein